MAHTGGLDEDKEADVHEDDRHPKQVSANSVGAIPSRAHQGPGGRGRGASHSTAPRQVPGHGVPENDEIRREGSGRIREKEDKTEARGRRASREGKKEKRGTDDTPLPQQTLSRKLQERVIRAKGKVVDCFKQHWEDGWDTYRSAVQERRKQPTHRERISQSRTQKLHAELAKAESSLAVRTGVIGFADFLHRMGRSVMLRDTGTTDFQTLTSTGKGVKAACRWLIKLGILGQYRLAAELLYQ
ncbi:MAG: hypothetical protein MMC33_007852 [Icmadophila ericetorum]|nr:hypothetical protein [Icmadophila ericetorum]